MGYEYDRDEVRKHILNALANPQSDHGLHISHIYQVILPHYRGKESLILRKTIVEEVLKMQYEGLLTPAFWMNGGDIVMRTEFFSLSQYGESVHERMDVHPVFVEEYLRRLESVLPDGYSLDEVVRFYVRESVHLFKQDFHTASVVMLGIASEQVVELLGKSISDTLKDNSKGEFNKILDHNKVSDKINAIVEKVNGTGSKSVKDFFDHAFRGFVTLLRKSRNEYGHPTKCSATRVEALGYLFSFPEYLRRMYQVIEYYNTLSCT